MFANIFHYFNSSLKEKKSSFSPLQINVTPIFTKVGFVFLNPKNVFTFVPHTIKFII